MRRLDAQIDILKQIRRAATKGARLRRRAAPISVRYPGSTYCSSNDCASSTTHRAGADTDNAARAVRRRQPQLIDVPAPQFAIKPKDHRDHGAEYCSSASRAMCCSSIPTSHRAERAMAAATRADRRREGGKLLKPHAQRQYGLGEHAVRDPALRRGACYLDARHDGGPGAVRRRPARGQRRFATKATRPPRRTDVRADPRCVRAGAGRHRRALGARRRGEAVAAPRVERRAAPSFATCQQSLFGWPRRVPRRDHRAASAAHGAKQQDVQIRGQNDYCSPFRW